MAFEIVDKGTMTGQRMGDEEVSISGYGLTFGVDFNQKFAEKEYCEIFLDQEGRRVGLKPTTNNLTGFKVGNEKNGRGKKSISGSWAKRIASGRYTPIFQNGNIIIENIDVVDKNSQIKKNKIDLGVSNETEV